MAIPSHITNGRFAERAVVCTLNWNHTLLSERVPSPRQIPLSFQLKLYSKQENGY